MRRYLSYLILAATALSASADVLIYRTSEKVKATGGGNEGTSAYRGYCIIDLGATNAVFIRWHELRGNKRYFTDTLSRAVFTRVEGKNHSYFFLTESLTGSQEPWSSYISAKGQNQDLIIGTGKTAFYPRTLSGSAGQVGPDPQVGNISFEVASTFVYSQAITVANNDAGNGLASIVDTILQQLEAEGYSGSRP